MRLNQLRDRPADETRVLQLTPGAVYRLPPTGIILDGIRNATIEGNGATLLMTSHAAFAMRVANCKNVTLRNLKIDYDPLPFTQGTVTSVNVGKRQIGFTLHDGYPDLKTRTVGADESVALLPRIYLFEPDKHQWRAGSPSYAASDLQFTGKRSGRLTFVPWTRTEDIALFKPGDRIACITLEADAIRITGSAGLVWEDITVHASPYVAFMLRSNEETGEYRRITITPGPPPPGATEPRLMSANADGFNSGYARRGPLLEDSSFGFHGDDSVNLHGPMLPIVEWPDENTCLSAVPYRENRADLLAREGDTIRFLLAPDYHIEKNREIVAITRIEEIGERRKQVDFALKTWGASGYRPKPENMTIYRIALKPAAGGARLATRGLFADIPALGAPGYIIRNNTFHDHNARGLRLGASNGRVVGNHFARIKQVAIALGPEYSRWREAGWVSNVVVENNIIRDVCESTFIFHPAMATPGAISVTGAIDAQRPPVPFPPGNRGIVIRNNDIEGCPVDAIHVVGTDAPVVEGNTFRNVSTLAEKDRKTAGRDLGLQVGTGLTIVPASASVPASVSSSSSR